MSEFCGHGKRMNQCIECCRSEPNPSLEALTLEAIASYIKSPSCKKIGVLSGAGISAANGIPTYRGKGGLYETLDATKLSASPAERAELATPEAVRKILLMCYRKCCAARCPRATKTYKISPDAIDARACRSSGATSFSGIRYPV